jgi:TonB family protein
MNRLQKKCLISAAGFHLLLLLILFVGPAFLSSQQSDPAPAITMITLDAKLTDGPSKGGGIPNSPPPAPAPPPQPQVTPPTAPPQVVEPPKPQETKSFLDKFFPPDPPKPIIKPDEADPIETKTPPKKSTPQTTKVKPDLTIVKRSANPPKKSTAKTEDSEEDSRAAAAAAATARRIAAVNSAIHNLKGGLSSGTSVTVPGPGGAAFANYRDAVRIAYMDAWIAPTEAADDKATTTVSVTIARNGTVISARIKTPSGDPATDRSVDQTLRRVKSIAPFPEGTTDSERTFIIKFDLTKKLLG